MRAWVLVLVLAGCYDPKVAADVPCGAGDACPHGLACFGGRCLAMPPEFDAPVVDARSIDAPPVTCNGVPEGDACDDHNICTATSTCRSGTCTPATPMASCTVADSRPEFASTQGTNGWWYGLWYAATDGDGLYAPSELALASYIDFAWRPPDYATNFSWAQTTQGGGHPDDSPRLLPIRRWQSDVLGPARVVVMHRKADTGGGDGTRAILVVDGTQVWMHDVAGTDGVGVTELVDVELSIGSTVDFLLDPLTYDGQDTTEHAMTIVSR